MSDRKNDQDQKKVSSATSQAESRSATSLQSQQEQDADVSSANGAFPTTPVGDAVAKLPGNGMPPPLASAPLAYENPTFLNSPDGRLIRIVAEYMEPLARFRRERIQDTVVFFGSARFRGKEEADHELELLDNTGSTRPAPSEEQPAKPPEIAAG